MSLLDQQNLFGSGPHRFTASPWQRQLHRRSFPGLAGELALDLGLRSRTIDQTGRLQGSTAADVQALIEAIEAYLDGQTHSLTDNHGATYACVLVEEFELTTPIRIGRGCWCEYRIVYRQLP